MLGVWVLEYHKSCHQNGTKVYEIDELDRKLNDKSESTLSIILPIPGNILRWILRITYINFDLISGNYHRLTCIIVITFNASLCTYVIAMETLSVELVTDYSLWKAWLYLITLYFFHIQLYLFTLLIAYDWTRSNPWRYEIWTPNYKQFLIWNKHLTSLPFEWIVSCRTLPGAHCKLTQMSYWFLKQRPDNRNPTTRS